MAAEISMQELKEETLKKIREMALEPQSGSFLTTRSKFFLPLNSFFTFHSLKIYCKQCTDGLKNDIQDIFVKYYNLELRLKLSVKVLSRLILISLQSQWLVFVQAAFFSTKPVSIPC
jgi:hypothetical protein